MTNDIAIEHLSKVDPILSTIINAVKLPEIESIMPFLNTTAVTLYFPDFNDLHFKKLDSLFCTKVEFTYH